MTSRTNLIPNGNTTVNGEHRPRAPPPRQPSSPFSSSNLHNSSNHRPYYPMISSSSSSSVFFKGYCCCLFLLFSFLNLFILALLVPAVVLVTVLALEPKKPYFDLQQVGVQYMGINSPNPTPTADPNQNPASASLSLNIRMLLYAANPNKVGIKYGESRFTVMYHGIALGKASILGFYQDTHTVRQVVATIAVDRVKLLTLHCGKEALWKALSCHCRSQAFVEELWAMKLGLKLLQERAKTGSF